MMRKNARLRVLERADIEAIHGASLEVLDQVGVSVDLPSVLDLLERNGFAVDRGARRVRMPESLVLDAVKSCKKNFRWHARDVRRSFDAVDGRTKFGPGAQCLYYLDPETGIARSATLRDSIRMCRLLDALDSSSLGYMPTYPSDVSENAMSVIGWLGGILNSSKQAFGGWGSDDQWELMLRIVEILFGSREAVRKKVIFPAYVDPISPLGHDQSMLETLIKYSESNIPVFVMVMALAGGTAPASLAGLLAQQNAEILSSIAIAKCVTRSPTIIYGSVSCPMDMRSGTAATGSPEFGLLGAASVQMAKFYRLPSDIGVQSDSKTVDSQTSYEKMQSALIATTAGADFAELFLGSTEAFNAYSPTQLMIDDEIASYALRVAQGIRVDEASLSVDVIAKTGPRGNYLAHPKTLKQFREEHSQARLSDRNSRQKWSSSGAKSAEARAKERIEGLLASHVPLPLEPEQRKAFASLLAEHTTQYTLEDLEKV